MTKDEALKLALEALELNNDEWKSLADSGDAGVWKAEDQDHYRQTNDAITAIKAALAQPAQEPVAHIPLKALEQIKPPTLILNNVPIYGYGAEGTVAVYTAPPQRKPLTEPECVDEMLKAGFERSSLGWTFTYGRLDYHMLKFARAIEAAHGIKEENT